MKKVLVLLAAAVLMFGFSSQAMAAFSSGDLIQVVYQANGSYEVATDLGSVSSLGGLTAAYSGATKNLSGANTIPLPGTTGAFSTANWSDLTVAFYVAPATTTSSVWLDGAQAGQTMQARKGGNLTSLDSINAQYALAGTVQVVRSLATDPSFYFTMEHSGNVPAGQFNQSITSGNGDQKLGALATAGNYVDSYLYYYANAQTGGAGKQVATLRTYADGHTAVLGTTPIPPSVLLLGSGLLGLVGIRRKMSV